MSAAGRTDAERTPVLTVRECAAYLRTHTSTIYRMLKRGEITAFRVGSDWRFLESEVEKFTRRNDAGRADGA